MKGILKQLSQEIEVAEERLDIVSQHLRRKKKQILRICKEICLFFQIRLKIYWIKHEEMVVQDKQSWCSRWDPDM